MPAQIASDFVKLVTGRCRTAPLRKTATVDAMGSTAPMTIVTSGAHYRLAAADLCAHQMDLSARCILISETISPNAGRTSRHMLQADTPSAHSLSLNNRIWNGARSEYNADGSSFFICLTNSQPT